MILCVTLNPCLDKTLTVPAWKPGESVRGVRLGEIVGGKGNNVARALKQTGHANVRPVTFLGGSTGDHCAQLLRNQDRFEPLVVSTVAQTRVILTVTTQSTGDQTAFFDPDPAIEPQEAAQLIGLVEAELKSGQVTALTLSGSSPSPATHGVFRELVALALARKVPTFLDTYGPALTSIHGFWPTVMQVNHREATQYLKRETAHEADILGLLQKWANQGVDHAIVTNGPDPAWARIGGLFYKVTPPQVPIVNPIGSGDCLLAGQVDAWLKKLDPEPSLRRAFAYGVANAMVWDAGQIDPGLVANLESKVIVEPMTSL